MITDTYEALLESGQHHTFECVQEGLIRFLPYPLAEQDITYWQDALKIEKSSHELVKACDCPTGRLYAYAPRILDTGEDVIIAAGEIFAIAHEILADYICHKFGNILGTFEADDKNNEK